MAKIIQLCLVSLLLIAEISNAENIHLQINGLSGELEKNVRAQLSMIEIDEVIPNRRLYARIDDAIRNGLKALGYYEPIIRFDFNPSQAKGKKVLIIHVSQGEPVVIGGINIVLHGDARLDKDYLELLTTCPTIGTVLNHSNYDCFKKNLINIALRKGYFDSQFTKSQLKVSIEQHQAFWDINYDSGKRYRFGEVTFEGSQIRNEYLQNLIPFKKGDYYQSRNLSELNRRLLSTGWFNSVSVTPKFNNLSKNNKLPLHGMVSPHTKNTIETGFGYSANAGPHMKLIWKKPWTNSHGCSLIISSNISEPKQQLDFIYKIPILKNPLEQYYLLQGNFKSIDFKNVKQDSTMIAISRYWDLFKGWGQAVNLRWSFDRFHFIQTNITNITMLFYPSIMISRIRSFGGLMPVFGDSQRYSIDYSNSLWGSDVDFSVIQAQNTWIRTLRDKHRFIIRGNLGWIETKDFKRVPLDLRFFAGGDRSIRGYKHRSISPKNKKNQLTGASKLATGSLEYQYNFSRKWWSAVFVDSGEAINNIQKNNFKTGTGIGVRWKSPIGAIKLDFAIPINEKNRNSLQFYIGFGPEL